MPTKLTSLFKSKKRRMQTSKEDSNNNDGACVAAHSMGDEVVEETLAKWPPPMSEHEPRSVVDNVHGNITLFHPLETIVDTQVFQRQRDLKQLGLAHLVYPSGVHNRFSHSLGTYWLAHKFVEHFIKSDPGLEITSQDHLCVCIAALCHDIGHGPYSHLYDGPFMEAVGGSKFKHEDASRKLIRRVLALEDVREAIAVYLGTGEQLERNVEFICNIVGSKKFSHVNEKSVGSWLQTCRPMKKAFLYDIVSNDNDGIDVDKWDYLIRDSAGTGVAIAFNLSSINRLIDNSRVLTDERGFPRICYAIKIDETLNQIGHARQQMHELVYQHKTARSIEAMLVRALVLSDRYLLFRGDDGRDYCLSEAHKDMGAYIKTNDAVLTQIANSTREELAEARGIIDDIYRRRMPVRVDELLFTPDEADLLFPSPPSPTNMGENGSKEEEEHVERLDINIVVQVEIEAMLRDKLAVKGVLPKDKADDIMLLTRTMHRGHGRKDPMSDILYFDHKRRNETPKPRGASEEQLRLKGSASTAYKVALSVYVSKDRDEDFRDAVREAFGEVAKERGLRGEMNRNASPS